MLREYDSFSRQLGRWLEGFGFTGDPFAVYEADRERPYLHLFFVDRRYLHGVLGDPAHPQTAILLAGQGDGKTATREMVAYECAHARLRRRALAVRYYDFSLLLEQVDGDVSQISARHHVQAIARATVKALVEDVPPTYFDLLEPIERALLAGYAKAFADPVTCLKLSKILPDTPVQLDWSELSPVEALETLAELVTKLGQSSTVHYQSLYILVDRVDETPAGPDGAVALLQPLVSHGPLLEMRHAAFKFFLPIKVGQQLRENVRLRPDRLYTHTISWDHADLEKLIQQRLYYFSDGQVARIEELCTSGAKTKVMDRLIGAGQGSPRTLLRLCQSLIHHHVQRTNNALIEPKDVTETIIDFKQQLEVEAAQAAPGKTIPAAAPHTESPPDKGLYLGEGGHVVIDGEPLTPPLSELEFKLLHTLYQQAPEIVSNEALIENVWPADTTRAGIADDQNLRKLIARLRRRLALDQPDRQTRFVQNARGRGYWLRVQ